MPTTPGPDASRPDSELVLSCQKGNLENFDALYTRYLKGVYAFIFYRTMERYTAEDLTSQTFLKALEHIGSYNPSKGAFSTWLYRIARNTVHDHFRTNRKHDDIDSVWDLPGEDNPFLDTANALSYEEIRSALKTLPKDKRDLVLMRLWDGLSYKEIADLTGKSEASLKMMFSRTIQDLRTDLTPAAFLVLCFLPRFL
jgi:RNA polymerase sigma-70 factor (ECF subfamily)